MEAFIPSRNIARYRRLLESTSDESLRWTLLVLLAEELQKQVDAGDDAQEPAQAYPSENSRLSPPRDLRRLDYAELSLP